MSSISIKRIKKDIEKLKELVPDLQIINKNREINFKIKGPKDTEYEGGEFTVNIILSKEYPFKSPSVGFLTRIYHPNIDELSGSICLDVLNQKWAPTYSLVNIYNMFLPQLLTYPNPDDPLNELAALLLKTDRKKFAKVVKYYINAYCE
jgi:ubiquitin-conjugating enzyme E2 H